MKSQVKLVEVEVLLLLHFACFNKRLIRMQSRLSIFKPASLLGETYRKRDVATTQARLTVMRSSRSDWCLRSREVKAISCSFKTSSSTSRSLAMTDSCPSSPCGFRPSFLRRRAASSLSLASCSCRRLSLSLSLTALKMKIRNENPKRKSLMQIRNENEFWPLHPQSAMLQTVTNRKENMHVKIEREQEKKKQKKATTNKKAEKWMQ